jgi:hypothetical protein
MQVSKDFSSDRAQTPALVVDKFNLGWTVRYVIRWARVQGGVLLCSATCTAALAVMSVRAHAASCAAALCKVDAGPGAAGSWPYVA